MKNLFLLILLILSSFNWGFGQNAFRTISSNFNDHKQFFISELNTKTIRLYLKEKKPNEEIREVLENIEKLKVLSFATQNNNDIESFINLVDSNYELEQYTPFRINRSAVNNQMIYLKEQNDLVEELLVINTNFSTISMVEVIGTMDLERLAILQNVLNIKAMESLGELNTPAESIDQKDINNTKHTTQRRNNTKFEKRAQNYLKPNNPGGVSIYNHYGNRLMDTQSEPSMFINGYHPTKDFHSTLSEINPNCIQSINVAKEDETTYPNGHIDILLKGDLNHIYTVCDGTLYFGQNGYLQTVLIDDDCGPDLLLNCKKKPLSAILQMSPESIRSIKITTDPLNCDGLLNGEYIVIESE